MSYSFFFSHLCTANPNTPDHGSTLSNIMCFFQDSALRKSSNSSQLLYITEKKIIAVADAWVVLVLAVSPLLLPSNKMLLSKARSFSKAYRCHLAAHTGEGKKPVFLGVVIRVRKGIPGVAGWSCSLEVPPCNGRSPS